MKSAKRLVLNQCCGVLIDVQHFFLKQVEPSLRAKLETNSHGFAQMLGYLRVPIIATLERPLAAKGGMPRGLEDTLNENELAETFEKDYFDLTKHKEITGYLRGLKKKQIVLGGCETDVCVLQSCLGLLSLGYEVFVVEELLFSSSKNVRAAVARMKNEGAIFISLKTLYYELLEAVETSPQRKKLVEKFGPFPELL